MSKKVILCILLTAFCFGTMEIAGKIAGNTLDATQFTFWRFLVGSIVLLPLMVWERRKEETKLTAGPVLAACALGIMLVPGSMYVLQLGLMRCNASVASVLICTSGILTIVFAALFAGEKFTKYKALLLGMTLVGIFFLISPWDVKPGNTVGGILLALLSAVTFALYTVLGKFVTRRIGPISQACISLSAGTVAQLIIMLIAGLPVTANLADNIGVLLYAGLVVTGLGYSSMFICIKNSDASTSAISFFLKIGLAPLLAMLLLKETIPWNGWIGIILVFIPSFLNIRSNFKAAGNTLVSKQNIK